MWHSSNGVRCLVKLLGFFAWKLSSYIARVPSIHDATKLTARFQSIPNRRISVVMKKCLGCYIRYLLSSMFKSITSYTWSLCEFITYDELRAVYLDTSLHPRVNHVLVLLHAAWMDYARELHEHIRDLHVLRQPTGRHGHSCMRILRRTLQFRKHPLHHVAGRVFAIWWWMFVHVLRSIVFPHNNVRAHSSWKDDGNVYQVPADIRWYVHVTYFNNLTWIPKTLDQYT